MGLIRERLDRADAFRGNAKSLPAYIASYNADGDIYNGNEVANKREQGLRNCCRYMIKVFIAKNTLPVGFEILEKSFMEREDAKKCILWLAEEPPTIAWAHVYYIKDSVAIALRDVYNPFLEQHFEIFA